MLSWKRLGASAGCRSRSARLRRSICASSSRPRHDAIDPPDGLCAHRRATCRSSSRCGTASISWRRSCAGRAPRQGADLAPSRRRDQRDRGRAARHRDHPSRQRNARRLSCQADAALPSVITIAGGASRAERAHRSAICGRPPFAMSAAPIAAAAGLAARTLGSSIVVSHLDTVSVRPLHESRAQLSRSGPPPCSCPRRRWRIRSRIPCHRLRCARQPPCGEDPQAVPALAARARPGASRAAARGW